MTEPNECESMRQAAMALSDNEESEISEQVVREHLSECSDCRVAIHQLADIDGRFGGVERQRHEVDVWPAISSGLAGKGREGEASAEPHVSHANEGPAGTPPSRTRWVASTAAVLLLVGLATWLLQTTAGAAPTFGEVVESVQNAKSLKLQVTRNGRSHEVLVRGGDSLRWIESDDRYQIAKGDRLWRIDEHTERFNTDKATFFTDDGLDLFALIGVTADRSAALQAEPVEGGWLSSSYVFRLPARRGSQDVHIEAVAAKDSGRLRNIRVLSIEDDESVTPFVFCELAVEAFDEPLDESLFIVAKTLTEDFRIGRIVDSEGVVTVKPVMRERWTPVSRETVLKRGDWIRTDPRGPNAVAVHVGQTRLTLGPGALVELIDNQQARVHRGEVKVEADKTKAFEVIAGKADALKVEGKKLLRLDGDEFKVLTHTPQWLAGFEGTQSDESLGSLIANVDGRDVPLTVGYHKVSVEIRDQIARTTIEESFVNHTNSRLEGQFYFPLPQDASISGFGMWIGNELVEADVVEKQRAREIFEIILREKRDPGLLEWTGGNIFKARVFPIFPHSEKRIKITYTQVLPLRGSKYRYSYGLRSELLKQNPLRELSIDLKVYSESKLRQIACPSHAARIEQTEHAGHIEFNAQEYSPDADFEAVIDIDGRSNDVVVIPHQRGDDGYFMLQLMPPGVDGNWQRDLLPDGEPLKLLVLADTSSSMDDEHRSTQDEFIASLLMSLGSEDQFNLAACDVECDWVFDEMQSPVSVASSRRADSDDDDERWRLEATNTEFAREFLANRVSLGWTDLDRAFASVLERADENTHVVYIGDGVVTAGSADPDEFVNRLQRLTRDCESTFHAVTVGSSYETVVLKSIASVGGGSFRQVNAEQGPQDIAKELLSEITQPGLTDLNVEIRGLRVARMYPEELPNIAAGTQHIIIGRYLPEGRDQRGEVVVTGKRGDESIRYKARFTLADAEQGNSFIPRLWARAHLDQLLSQGRSTEIQDEVIALSEEYHIMTPYTSLLVLESDADRERFKVKRRFLMRDGEKFFAEGRKKANYELIQKQMKLAGLWRQNLRTKILKSFTGMGRDASLLNPWQLAQQWSRGRAKYGKDSGFGNYGWSEGRRRDVQSLREDLEHSRDERDSSDDDYDEEDSEQPPDAAEMPADSDPADSDPLSMDDAKADMESPAETPPAQEAEGDMDFADARRSEPSANMGYTTTPPNEIELFAYSKTEGYPGATYQLSAGLTGIQSQVFSFDGFGIRYDQAGGPGRPAAVPQTTAWLVNLFPQVGPANTQVVEKASTWPEDAIELSNSLLRIESLATIHGLEVDQTTTTHDPRWDRVSSIAGHRYLNSKDRWLNHPTTPGSTPYLYFCDADQRGVYSQTMLLGRVRKSEPSDRATPNLPAADHSLRPLHKTFSHLTAKVEDADENRKRLMLSHVDYEFRILIDTERHVILETEEHRNGRQQNRVVFSEFRKVAGRDWASKITTHRNISDAPLPAPRADDEPTLHLVSETALDFRVLNEAAFARRYDTELVDKPRVQFLQVPLPDTADAREARTGGKADFEDHIVLADYFHHSGQWRRVKEHITAMETLAGEDKPGMWFVRNAMLREIDRESMRVRIVERARELAAEPSPDDLSLAGFLFGQTQQITAYNEQLEILNTLKPVYDRQPEHAGAERMWLNLQIGVLSGLGHNDQVVELRHKLAVENPWDATSQTAYAYALINTRQDHDSAVDWLRTSLTDHADKWTTNQDESFRNIIATQLEGRGRYAELLEHTRAWEKRNPNSYNVHARLLTALVWNDRLDEAETTIRNWLKAGVAVVTDEDFDAISSFQPQVEVLLPRDVTNRMNAALNMAMGQGYNLYTYRIDPKWLQPLSRVVFTFARQRNHSDYANRIISHGHFVNTEEAGLIRQQAFKVLNEELATLPLHELQTFLQWSLRATERIEREQWVEIADRLEERWAHTQAGSDKHRIGSLLLQVLSSRLDMERRLVFMRRQIEEGGEDYRQSYIIGLFHLLLAQPAWKDEFEIEAFSWLPKLSEGRTGTRMMTILPALYRLSDQMISQRYQTALKDVDHETKANRIAYRKKKSELYRAARAGYLQRLADVMVESDDWLAAWMKIEHIYLSIRQGNDLKGQARVVRDFIGDAPPERKLPATQDVADPQPDPAADSGETVTPEEQVKLAALQQEQLRTQHDESIRDFFAGLLRHRYVLTAAHLSTRRDTTNVIADSLLKYVDAGIAKNPVPDHGSAESETDTPARHESNDTPEGAGGPVPPAVQTRTARNLNWKSAKYRLLIALDRPAELERDLTTWIREDRETAPWRLSLARLLAEQGRLDEAVRLYKAVEHADELRPSEYRALSDWYLALDNQVEYESAKFMYYATMSENGVNQLLNRQLQRYQATDGSAPATLDTDILLMVRALLEKSEYPSNYINQVRALYATTKDFRLFRSVPIAALGQTAGHTYNMVSNCQYAFSAVMEEATVDEIVELLRATRDAAESEVDQRALDLLEVVAERRAVELQNQSGPHVRPMLAALKRAFDHEWADGEHSMMMNFLSNLGRMPQDELAEEQQRQMKQLYAWSEAGTFDRLQMANLYVNTLWNYGSQATALVEMEAAIAEFEAASGNKWPQEANGILDGYLRKLQQKGRYADVEKIILDHLTRTRNLVQLTYFENRLDKLYYDALSNGAQVSLGKGEVLYRAYLARLLKRLETADDNLAWQLVGKTLEILKHARRLKWADANPDSRSFAYERVPELLQRSTNNYRNILGAAGNHVREFFGATEAIPYMLDRIDQDPARFRYRNDDAWNHHASSLGGWLYHVIHTEKRTLPEDLDARLLKFALAELRRDLTSHQQRGRYFYGHNYGYFWEAHRADFLRETEAVLADRKESGDAVAWIAAYLYQISELDRCIEIMFEAHRAGRLTDNHIHTLVSYLHFKKRYGESVPLLEGLVERSPNNLGHRTSLMFTYFKVDRKNQMMALLDATHEYFHKENRWAESAMYQLASACSNCELWERSATYYSDAIMERRRTNPTTAAGDGTLSSYYSQQAEAYLQLGRTRDAVEAAAGGIVSWGRNHNYRNNAVNVLVSILNRATDRDDYVAWLDKEAERTQQDRPIVRKALGMAYQQKGEYAKAAAQLKIAAELQPGDAATHTALISCYDSLKDAPAAITATLAFLQLDRRNVDTYTRLGQRLKADTRQQERAYTGMVEMKPNEADSHTRLAEIRQRQDRWDAAIDHWKHVVRIRSLEPTGLVGLITAEIHEQRFADARRNVKKLAETDWPQRFGSVQSHVDRFRRQLNSK